MTDDHLLRLVDFAGQCLAFGFKWAAIGFFIHLGWKVIR